MLRYATLPAGLVTWRRGVISILAALVLGCGPEVDDDEGAPPGTLEYEDPLARYHRLDRRVDIIGLDPMVDHSGCGFLTDRAYDELLEALGTLDSQAEYATSECEYEGDGLVYLEGFTHSPFSCTWYCCHLDLLPVAVVYFAVGSNLDGQYPNIDGEPYVALEPDMPCPE